MVWCGLIIMESILSVYTSLNQTNLIISQSYVIKRQMEGGGPFSRGDRMVVSASTKTGESMKTGLVKRRVNFGWGSAKSIALFAGKSPF